MMTVPIEAPLPGANVVADTAVPLYGCVMVVYGPVKLTGPGVFTMTVPVESPLAGLKVVTDTPVPL
jgi:hypothetical protein